MPLAGIQVFPYTSSLWLDLTHSVTDPYSIFDAQQDVVIVLQDLPTFQEMEFLN